MPNRKRDKASDWKKDKSPEWFPTPNIPDDWRAARQQIYDTVPFKTYTTSAPMKGAISYTANSLGLGRTG